MMLKLLALASVLYVDGPAWSEQFTVPAPPPYTTQSAEVPPPAPTSGVQYQVTLARCPDNRMVFNGNYSSFMSLIEAYANFEITDEEFVAAYKDFRGGTVEAEASARRFVMACTAQNRSG